MVRHPAFLRDAHGDEDAQHAVHMSTVKPVHLSAVYLDLRHLAVALSGLLRPVPRLPSVAGCCAEADVSCDLNGGERRVGSSDATNTQQK